MNYFLRISNLLILFLLCGIIFFPFLGEVNLFDWDETLIASVSKEMYMHSEVLYPMLNGEFYLDTPPFFFWIQSFSFNYLGVNEYASRIPNAICALLVVLTLYKNGKRMYSTNFGMMWAIVYMSMVLPQLYHKSSLQEVWFNFFIYLSIYNLVRVIQARQESGEEFYKKRDVFSNLFYSAFAMTGAMLTKGIEAYIIVLLTYWLLFLFSSAKYGFGYKNILKWTLYVILMLMIWVGITYKWHGGEYLSQFFQYQFHSLDIDKASWTNRFFFQFIVLFVGCFPASAIFLNSIQLRSYESTIQKVFRLAMISCLVVILIITCFFKVKTAHYSVLAYYPISFLAAYSLRFIFEEKKPIHWISYCLIIIGGLIWACCLTIVPVLKLKLNFLKKHIQDDTFVEAFSKYYNWDMIEVGIGVFFCALFLVSLILMFVKKWRFGLFLLFFSTMITAEIVLIYYVPKIEQITQGPQIEFIKQNLDEKKEFHYYNGESYIANFYSNDYNHNSNDFHLDSMEKYDLKHTHHYLIAKKSDSGNLEKYQKNLQYLYPQGIYTFYKIKENKKRK